jgi:hypothetical protein
MLGSLQARLDMYDIEITPVLPGAALSHPMQHAAHKLAFLITREIGGKCCKIPGRRLPYLHRFRHLTK